MAQSIEFNNAEIKRVLLSLEDNELSYVKKLNKSFHKEHKKKDIDWNSVVVKCDKALLVMPYYGGEAESRFDEDDEEMTAHMMTFNYVLKRREKAEGITVIDIIKCVIKHNNAMREFTDDYPFSAEVSLRLIDGWKMTSNSTINMPVIYPSHWGS